MEEIGPLAGQTRSFYFPRPDLYLGLYRVAIVFGGALYGVVSFHDAGLPHPAGPHPTVASLPASPLWVGPVVVTFALHPHPASVVSLLWSALS